jgi:hypothetical protein
MVAYSFRSRFVDPILQGEKRQTIRHVGKRKHAVKGDALQLYQGMRTRHCKLIMPAVCAGAGTVWINFDVPRVLVNTESADEHFEARPYLDTFAKADGFDSWPALVEFWSVEHFKRQAPSGIWQGVIIRW